MVKGWYGNRQQHMMASRGIKSKKIKELEDATKPIVFSMFRGDAGDGVKFEDVNRGEDSDKAMKMVNFILEHGKFVDNTHVFEGYPKVYVGNSEVYTVDEYICEITMWNEKAENRRRGQMTLECIKGWD